MKKFASLFHLRFDPQKRVLGLDIFRTISILVVLKVHGNIILQQYWPNLPPSVGISGPELFFVLSGYLIGQIFMTRISRNPDFGVSDVWQFIRRRWFRTLPNYYLFLAFNFIILVTIQNQFKWEYLSYFVFGQNLFTTIPPFFPESWSLTIEEWFYLSMPFWIYLFYKVFHQKNFLKPIISYMLLMLLFRVFAYYFVLDSHLVSELRPYSSHVAFIRLDSIMIGVLAAYFKMYFTETWFRFRFPLLIVGLFLVYLMHYTRDLQPVFFQFNFRFIIHSAGAAMLLSFFDAIRKGSRFWVYIFTHISMVSYSMYLSNLPMMGFIFLPLLAMGVMPFWLLFILFVVSNILVSTLIYKFFEKPVMDLREGKSLNLRKLRFFKTKP